MAWGPVSQGLGHFIPKGKFMQIIQEKETWAVLQNTQDFEDSIKMN